MFWGNVQRPLTRFTVHFTLSCNKASVQQHKDSGSYIRRQRRA